MKKSILVLLLIISMVISSFTLASNEISNKEDELGDIQKQIKDLDEEIRDKESSKKQIVKDVDDLNDSIRNLDKEITNISGEISVNEEAISKLETLLEETNENLEIKTDIFYSRLRVMYKSKDIGYFEILFGAEDFEDLLTRIDMMKMIFMHDINLMKDINDELLTIEELKAGLEGKEEELLVMNSNLNSKQDNLDMQVDLLENKKDQLSKDLEALENQVDRLNDDADSLTKIIENMKLQEKYVGGVMTWPTPGIYRITSPFGYRIHPILNIKKLHTGIDIGVPKGTKVVAAQAGRIIYSDWYGGYGLVIMIDHGGGYVTLYGHNSKLVAKVGTEVAKGELISYSGSTGLSTGPHLHFEVRIDGKYVDPLKYVTAQD